MKKTTLLTGLFILVMQAFAQPGSLIQTFGTNGVVRTSFGSLVSSPTSTHLANSLMAGANGKYYTSTEISGMAVVTRWNANGTVDGSYGSNGHSRGAKILLPSAAIQADQKVVVGGFQSSNYAVARFDTSGNFDPTFGVNGKVAVPFTAGGLSIVYTTYVQQDGKIVVAGTSAAASNFTLLRLLANGQIDAAFGNNGRVVLPLAGSICRAVAQQSDGKIVAAGTMGSGATMLGIVARFHENGILDSSFNGNGKFQATEPLVSLALQSDGKIVAAGGRELTATTSTSFLIRVKSNGTYDSSFNGNGKATFSFLSANSWLLNVRIASDGKIVASGRTQVTATNQDMLFVRFKANGTRDSSFNNNGFRIVSSSVNELQNGSHSGLLVQADGKLVQIGYDQLSTSVINTQTALRRLNANGTDDADFGSNGKAVTFINLGDTRFHDCVRQPDGKLVTAGLWNSSTTTAANNDFLIARFHENGTVDSSFNANGRVVASFGPNADVANAIVLQTDGKYVVGGTTAVTATPLNNDFGIMRLKPDGSLDSTFGNNGKVLLNFGSNTEALNVLLLQPDGKIVAIGNASFTATGNDFALARINSDGSPDLNFGTNGKVITSLSTGTGADVALSAALQKDGKIVVMGTHTNSGIKSIVVRYNPNGTLDNSFNTTGRAVLSLGSINETVSGTSVKVQPDGKIVAAASMVVPAPGIAQLAVVRFNTDGAFDNTFGTSGKVFGQFNGSASVTPSVAIQWDGRILVAGRIITMLGKSDVVVARYLPNGAADLTFNNTGYRSTEVVDGDATTKGMIIDQEQAYVFGFGVHYSPHGFIAGYNLGTSVFCAYGQGYFGNGNQDVCDGVQNSSAYDIINNAIGSGFTLGRNGKSVAVNSGTASVVMSVLPGGGPSKAFPNGNVVLDTSMNGGNYLKKNNGKINNSLFSQTLVLMLNNRMTGGTLANIPVQSGTLVTQATNGCGYEAEVMGCEESESALQSYIMNNEVANHLDNIGASTIGGLVDLANDVLGGVKTPGQNGVPSTDSILAAIETINSAFSDCRSFVGYDQTLCEQPTQAPMPLNPVQNVPVGSFKVYPNPGNGVFHINFPEEAEAGSLILSDINGKVITTKLLSTQKAQLDLSHLVKGIYLLQLQVAGTTYTARLVLN
jgi:uncharacterized delta-60 repeat protein